MELLCHQPRRITSVSWPEEVDHKLSLLVRVAAGAGEHTSRAQLLAALVAATETTPERLVDLLHDYRRLPADALADTDAHDDLPTIRTPGPRRTQT
ncbi:hypothetical protein [Streptomyces sp. NEAU-S77]|uniref:hypothetical protein n=1 Tax=Streptomyces sp. NEAU-S77 TaxID=3411033 RepID=UPI003BA25E4E